MGLAALLVVFIGALDYVTGSELSFSVFYLIPVALVAWFVQNDRLGYLMALAAAAVWLLVDLNGGRVYSSLTIPYWNAGVRLSFFVIVTFSLTSLRAARARQDELAHFVVHDLRSPLSNILSGLTLVLDTPDVEMDPMQRDLVKLSISAAHRMMSLVNSLLDLAQLESGKLKVNMRATAVQPLFDAALDQISAMALRGEVHIASGIDTGADSILADADLTVRVLVNLLSNALKYSPAEGTVSLNAVPHAGDMVALRIHDEGMGIAPEWVDKVFGKFTQVEARKAGAAIGSGLGLTFCRLAVEAQGGRIWLESEVGKGTTVILTLRRGPQN